MEVAGEVMEVVGEVTEVVGEVVEVVGEVTDGVGEVRDGVGDWDGTRGCGDLRIITIHTMTASIHIMRLRLLSPSSSLSNMFSQPRSRRNKVTGISAQILRATIHT